MASDLTAEEENFILRTASELKEAHETSRVHLQDGSFREFDLEEFLEFVERGESTVSVLQASRAHNGVTFGADSFGKCVAKELGIADAKAIIKAFGEPAVRKALKSRQWKVASSIVYETLKKISPNIAKKIIKKAAGSLLPGGAVVQLAIIAGKCGIKEL